MQDELKACPFCGCSVQLVERESRDELMGLRTWYHIEGKHTGIGSVCPGQVRARGSAETAITAWNTRADPALAAAQAEVARQEELARIYRRAQLTAEEKLCREVANSTGWKGRAAHLEQELKRMKEALSPFVTGASHTRVFLTTREKMHEDGVRLYDMDVDAARAALEPQP